MHFGQDDRGEVPLGVSYPEAYDVDTSHYLIIGDVSFDLVKLIPAKDSLAVKLLVCPS